MRESRSDTIEETAIPESLIERDQWVYWCEEERDGKATKAPVVPGTSAFASATDPDTWTEFDTALEFVDRDEADGIGFVFSEGDPIVGVDLDDCHDPETGEPDETAADVIERLDSYTEVSPSGTDFHVLVEGDLPDGRNRRGSIELYDSARFFTVTGDPVEEMSDRIARRQDALDAIHRDYVQEESHDRNEADSEGTLEAVSVDLDDIEVLEKARKAENGEKFEHLWKGHTAGYDSHSEADMALCCLLAFWTGGDRSQMDRLFRQSGLMREKWDETHYADGSTYGENTIERALSTVTEHYDPDTTTQPTPTAPIRASEPDHGRSDGLRSQAYLAERNRLLEDRVDELQAALQERNERIEALENKLRRIRQECP